MIKVLIITGISSLHQTGLYNSLIDRLRGFQGKEVDVDVISVVEVDSAFIRFIKRFFGLNLSYDSSKIDVEKVFNSTIRYVYVDKTVAGKVMERLFPVMYNKRIIKRIRQYITSDIDIIHAHWLFPHGYIACLLANELGKKYIVTGHGSDVHTLPLQSRFKKKIIQKVLEKATVKLFVSKQLLQICRDKIGIVGNAFVTYNGIQLGSLPQRYKESSELRVGFIGNLNVVKGAHYLPGIFEYIRCGTEKKIDFLVVGDGPLYSKLFNEFHKNKQLSFKMYGKLRRIEAKEVMRSLDLLIIPSLNEGFGIVAIEALSMGIPVAATSVGGLVEILEGTDFLYKGELNETSQSNFADFCLSLMFREYENAYFKEVVCEYELNKCIEKELEYYKIALRE